MISSTRIKNIRIAADNTDQIIKMQYKFFYIRQLPEKYLSRKMYLLSHLAGRAPR
jgi:hypothetical protein